MKVGILIFNEVEVLDFAGPFEVFALAENEAKEKLFEVKTIAQHKDVIKARNGLQIVPDFCFDDCPALDILIVPGGYGAEEIETHNTTLIQWIRNRYQQVDILASICTGAFLLARAGLLKNKNATTHWMDQERLQKEYKDLTVVKQVKYVDEGKVLTSGGISAGINLSFHIIKRLYGITIALHTARRMEYDIIPEHL